jgi:hypothetical protein
MTQSPLWKLPEPWTHRTRPQLHGNQRTISTSFHKGVPESQEGTALPRLRPLRQVHRPDILGHVYALAKANGGAPWDGVTVWANGPQVLNQIDVVGSRNACERS